MYDTDWTFLKEAIPVSSFILMKVSWAIRKATHGQGLGRHSQEEVMTIGQADLKALSDFLGEAFLLVANYSSNTAAPSWLIPVSTSP